MNKSIPLVDLKASYRNIKKEMDQAIDAVLQETNFIMGSDITLFEEEFARFHQVRFAIAISSGTDALHLILRSLDIGKGDEVILPSHTFTATAEVVVWTGAKPVFADINSQTYLLDPESVKRVISKKTKAIMPVHLYGQPVDLDAFVELSAKKGIFLIEDSAQAHGAEYKGKKVGNFGIASAFSFYPGKNLGAYGDAGMVVTNDENVAKKITKLRNHGRTEKYVHEIVGYGSRMDTMQAAILRVKLKYLSKWNKKRLQNALMYSKLLRGLKEVVIPVSTVDAKPVYHLYVIRAKRRDELKKYLFEKGIETGIHYPLPLHLQPAYQSLNYKKGDFPFTEQAVSEILSLPLYPELTNNQIRYICQCITEFYS